MVLAAAWEITARLPNVSLIVFTVPDAEADLFPALHAGAAGYLLKDIDPRAAAARHSGCCARRAALPRALMARVIEKFRGPTLPWRSPADDRRGARLTSREWQILRLTDEELTTRQIARRLLLTPATLRSHRSHILRRLRDGDSETSDEMGPTGS